MKCFLLFNFFYNVSTGACFIMQFLVLVTSCYSLWKELLVVTSLLVSSQTVEYYIPFLWYHYGTDPWSNKAPMISQHLFDCILDTTLHLMLFLSTLSAARYKTIIKTHRIGLRLSTMEVFRHKFNGLNVSLHIP